MSEQSFEPIEDADLEGVSGGTDDQQDPSNWYHNKCPKCGSTNVEVRLSDLGFPKREKCDDCGYTWNIIGPDSWYI